MSVKNSWEMCCPKCGSDESVNVEVNKWILLTEDGTEDSSLDLGNEWYEDSAARCSACDFEGIVKDFWVEDEV